MADVPTGYAKVYASSVPTPDPADDEQAAFFAGPNRVAQEKMMEAIRKNEHPEAYCKFHGPGAHSTKECLWTLANRVLPVYDAGCSFSNLAVKLPDTPFCQLHGYGVGGTPACQLNRRVYTMEMPQGKVCITKILDENLYSTPRRPPPEQRRRCLDKPRTRSRSPFGASGPSPYSPRRSRSASRRSSRRRSRSRSRSYRRRSRSSTYSPAWFPLSPARDIMEDDEDKDPASPIRSTPKEYVQGLVREARGLSLKMSKVLRQIHESTLLDDEE